MKRKLEADIQLEKPKDIFEAAKIGDLDSMRSFFQKGAEYDELPDYWECAIEEKVANANGIDSEGKTALHYAAENGHVDIIRFLLEKGADVNAQYKKNKENDRHNAMRTPLSCATENGHIAAMQLLLDNGADVNGIREKNVNAPLHFATLGGHLAAMQLLLDNGADINELTFNYGETPFALGVYMDQLPAIQLLLNKGADVSLSNPLGYAAANGNLAVMQLLLDNGADVNTQNNDGGIPLVYAAANGQLAAMQLLINNGADVNENDDDGKIPLCIAAEEGDLAAIQLLLDNGADVNGIYKNEDGTYSRTPLVSSLFHRSNFNAALLLIKNGADINAKTCYDDTLLNFYATGDSCSDDDLEGVRFLIENGADINSVYFSDCDDNIKNILLAAGYEIEIEGRKVKHPVSLPQIHIRAVLEDKEIQEQLSELNIKNLAPDAIAEIYYKLFIDEHSNAAKKIGAEDPIRTPEQNKEFKISAIRTAYELTGEKLVNPEKAFSRIAASADNVPTLRTYAARSFVDMVKHNILVDKEEIGKGSRF
ncbi:MAG: Pfs, and Ankyrin domain protein [Rickettsiaceae bacterium]|nr:Pfs, and Ankyrin domain protein [Rickettsiaceae bacterium]